MNIQRVVSILNILQRYETDIDVYGEHDILIFFGVDFSRLTESEQLEVSEGRDVTRNRISGMTENLQIALEDY